MVEDLRILPSPDCFPPLKLPPLEPWNGRDVQKQLYKCKLSHKAPPIKTLEWEGCSKNNHTLFNLKLPPLEPWNGRDVQKQSHKCKLSHKALPIKTLKWDGCSKNNHIKFNLKLPPLELWNVRHCRESM